MMTNIDVPGWLLIVLSALSVLLCFLVIIFSFLIIKNILQKRKFSRKKSGERYIPGKILAHFKETDKITNLSIIPKTFPTTLQTGNPFITPLWRVIPCNTCADSSNHWHGLSSRHFDQPSPYANQTKPKTCQKEKRTSVPSYVAEIRQLRPPLPEVYSDDSTSSENGHTTGNMIGDTMKASQCHTKEDEDSSVYSHADILLNVDTSNMVNDPDPVVNYNQDHQPVSKPPGPGWLFFILKYNPAVPELLITLKSGLDLVPVNGGENSPLNSYVNFCLVPEDFLWQRTKIIVNERNPVFNETFRIHDVLYHKLREYTLCFFVMDCTRPMGERVIGKVLYPLSDLRAEERVEVCKELSIP